MSDIPQELLEQVERLMKAAEGESERGKIILFATQIDETLKDLLLKFLKPRRAKREGDDELFRVFAPLSTFAGRIAASYRLGLISKDDADAFDILRDIRNDCAHKIFEFALTKPPHSDHLERFVTLTAQDPTRAFMLAGLACPKTDEECFIYSCIVHVLYLHETIARVVHCSDVFTKDLIRFKRQ
jgi:hypothetical protein